MKLLTALRRQPADNCIILTYNADLLFFEHLLFEPLYASGCRNTLVLCDPMQYGMALSDIDQLRYAGQRYLLIPARTSPHGAFHPKLILLTWSDGGRLFLTSGNLTQAGYTRNWEVVTLFEYDVRKPDPMAWAACHWAYQIASRIVATSDVGDLGQGRIEQLWGTTPWLRRDTPFAATEPVWLLHNLDKSLLDQLVSKCQPGGGSAVNDIVVVSPFLDPGARALDRLLEAFRPENLRLYTQRATHGLSPHRFKAVVDRHQTHVELFDLDLSERALHAKAILLRSESGVWLATGSPNLSRPAWLEPAATGNTEFAVLRFEQDPSYFDPWLQDLLDHATPMELDWDAETPLREAEPISEPRIALLSCLLRGRTLLLSTAAPIPSGETLTLRLRGAVAREISYERWEQDKDLSLSLPLDTGLVARLEGPVLVSLSVALPLGRMESNTVLIHNLKALIRYSRPVERRERPRIPEGLIPESYEHCAQLLEMIHELLATNWEQRRRHGGRITVLQDERQLEEQMTIDGEGEYDPEEHLVDERVRVVAPSASVDIYADYYDRLTYEELLRAALAAVYRPHAVGSDQDELAEIGDRSAGGLIEVEMPPPDDKALREQILPRIERGFRRLVSRFVQGLGDEEYLADVPAQYLLELLVIIATYLRVVWRDRMLTDEQFLEHSLDLLFAFWGRPGCPGAWEDLKPRISEDILADQEKRLSLSAQMWLHAYVVVTLLDEKSDRRIYDLAAWMREFPNILKGTESLASLPDNAWRRLWRDSFPPHTEPRPLSEIIARLCDVSAWYDGTSLLAEVGAWPGTRGKIATKTVAGLDVPALEANTTLSDKNLDRCLWAFKMFLQWPQPKPRAWACFTNVDPLTSEMAIRSVRLFYREDSRTLTFAVERASGIFAPESHVPDITVQEISGIESIAQILDRGGRS